MDGGCPARVLSLPLVGYQAKLLMLLVVAVQQCRGHLAAGGVDFGELISAKSDEVPAAGYFLFPHPTSKCRFDPAPSLSIQAHTHVHECTAVVSLIHAITT